MGSGPLSWRLQERESADLQGGQTGDREAVRSSGDRENREKKGGRSWVLLAGQGCQSH